MKSIFVLNFTDALIYDEDGLLIDAYEWPFGHTTNALMVKMLGHMIDHNATSLVRKDLNLYDITLHHQKLWNNPITGSV